MARRIKIKWETAYSQHKNIDGYRIRIEVACAFGMPTAIFVYRQMPTNPATGAKAGFFSHVASPVDLEEMPEQEPRLGEVPEWFRLSHVDILLRSTEEVMSFLQEVDQDVCRLKNSLDRLDLLAPAGEAACGPFFDCHSSSASSGSSVSSISGSSDSVGSHLRSCPGSMELAVGYGQAWSSAGLGAGSPVGPGDSIASDSRNASQVTLLSGLVSQQLIIQGFGCFGDIPDHALVTGVEARLVARWDSPPASESSSASQGSSASAEPFLGPELVYFRLYHPILGPVGDEKAAGNPIFGPGWQNIAFGGATDPWNAHLTGADVKKGNFGVMLVVYLTPTGPSERIDCDSTTPGSQGTKKAVVEVDGVELTLHWSS